MTPKVLRAPFPWFGGKTRAASLIWSRLGDVNNYVEPFAGSLAVLLGRPTKPGVETVNDLDGFVANFWRAVAKHPDEVARWAESPVNECDLHARHLWLVDRREELPLRLMADPDYCDAKIAGWWCWGLSSWIGSGWCSGNGPWRNVDGKLTKVAIPGVSLQIPNLGNNGQGVTAASVAATSLILALGVRLRRVRVVCGDWKRVTGPSVTCNLGSSSSNRSFVCGVVLDPPYAVDDRADLYNVDSRCISGDVRAWAVANGDNPKMRIALCGYEGEHEMPASWSCVPWKAKGGYGGQSKSHDNPNARRERIWFSPHCLNQTQGQLFG